MFLLLLSIGEARQLKNPQPGEWTGWTPSPSWGPTRVPRQTWPTNELPWPPTRSKVPTPDNHRLSTVAIVFIVLGSCLVVGIIIAVIVLWRMGKFSRKVHTYTAANENDDHVSLTSYTDYHRPNL